MSMLFWRDRGAPVTGLDNRERNGYIFTSGSVVPNKTRRTGDDMPRFSGRKPFHHEIFSRHIDEIRNLLHTLELRDAFDDGENRPLMDMHETAEGVVIEFDLPGFAPEDIRLTVRGMTLVLEAQRPSEKADPSTRFVCLERRSGRFHHAVHIPGSIDPCAISAEYRQGVLRVTCPKINDRQIPIKEIQA